MSTGSPSTRISTVRRSGDKVQTICAQISDRTGAGSSGTEFSRGIQDDQIAFRHVLRPALSPVVTTVPSAPYPTAEPQKVPPVFEVVSSHGQQG